MLDALERLSLAAELEERLAFEIEQMLFGDLPTRDFIDIGRPLTIVMSAAAQKLWGWIAAPNRLTGASPENAGSLFTESAMLVSAKALSISALITETGAAGIKDMGKVIGALKAKYAGQMDFGKASGMVKAALTG